MAVAWRENEGTGSASSAVRSAAIERRATRRGGRSPEAIEAACEAGAIRFVARLDDGAGTAVSFAVLGAIAAGVLAPVGVAMFGG